MQVAPIRAQARGGDRRITHPVLDEAAAPLCDLLANVLAAVRDTDAAAHRRDANDILQTLWREPVTRPLVSRAMGIDRVAG